jgi:hypothetical protein
VGAQGPEVQWLAGMVPPLQVVRIATALRSALLLGFVSFNVGNLKKEMLQHCIMCDNLESRRIVGNMEEPMSPEITSLTSRHEQRAQSLVHASNKVSM